jgi:hypothetical protein
MLGWFLKLNKNSPKESEFNHIMTFSHELAENNPEALIDLVRILLRPLQSELLLSAIKNRKHEARGQIECYKFFMPTGPTNIQMPWSKVQLNSNEFMVHLNRDPILPCPWHRDRYVSALANIGSGKSLGSWKVDRNNHFISVWLPWGIAFVGGGNHSIGAGIVAGEGIVRPNEVYDMGDMLEKIRCDGEHYRSILDDRILSSVSDQKIGALFEIGRLLRAHKITAMARSVQQGTAV